MTTLLDLTDIGTLIDYCTTTSFENRNVISHAYKIISGMSSYLTWIRVHRCTLKQNRRGSVRQRPVHYVTVARDPTDVSDTAEHISWCVVEHILQRQTRVQLGYTPGQTWRVLRRMEKRLMKMSLTVFVNRYQSDRNKSNKDYRHLICPRALKQSIW